MKQSRHDAIVVFILSFFCFIPYLNLFMSPIILYMSIIVLRKIKSQPAQFGGRKFAMLAFCLSILTIVLSYGSFILEYIY